MLKSTISGYLANFHLLKSGLNILTQSSFGFGSYFQTLLLDWSQQSSKINGVLLVTD